MKVSSVNLACWCASGVFVLGLIGFALQHKGRDSKALADQDLAKIVLKGKQVEAGPTRTTVPSYSDDVIPRWHLFDWTGKPPPVERVVVEDDTPRESPRKQVSDLLAIVFIQVDTDDPGGSRTRVQYKGELAQHGVGQLMVGDLLPAPHDYAAVHRILPESVIFSFTAKEGDAEPSENETVAAFNERNRFPIVGVDGNIIIDSGVPQSRAGQPRPNRRGRASTEEVEENVWQLGSEDVQEFSDDYRRILTQDVSTRTYYDEDGKRAGVEITSVKAGSIAARHGARTGDVVISINGHGVSSEQEAIKYVKNNSETTDTWEVVIMNMGRTETRVFHSPDE